MYFTASKTHPFSFFHSTDKLVEHSWCVIAFRLIFPSNKAVTVILTQIIIQKWQICNFAKMRFSSFFSRLIIPIICHHSLSDHTMMEIPFLLGNIYLTLNYQKDISPYFTIVLTKQPQHLLIFREITCGIISTPD